MARDRLFTQRGDRQRQGRSDDLVSYLTFEEVRDALVARWPRLDEQDLEAIRLQFDAFLLGNYQVLIGRLRERYGLSQTAAENEAALFVRRHDPSADGSSGRAHSARTLGYGKGKTR